jgi:hypothetical protein
VLAPGREADDVAHVPRGGLRSGPTSPPSIASASPRRIIIAAISVFERRTAAFAISA